MRLYLSFINILKKEAIALGFISSTLTFINRKFSLIKIPKMTFVTFFLLRKIICDKAKIRA